MALSEKMQASLMGSTKKELVHRIDSMDSRFNRVEIGRVGLMLTQKRLRRRIEKCIKKKEKEIEELKAGKEKTLEESRELESRINHLTGVLAGYHEALSIDEDDDEQVETDDEPAS